LRAAYNSPLFAEFESALPIVGTDGTLKRRFNGIPLSGNAHLKTDLRDVSALAGYVYTPCAAQLRHAGQPRQCERSEASAARAAGMGAYDSTRASTPYYGHKSP